MSDLSKSDVGRWIGRPYRQAVTELYAGTHIWDHVRYDEAGDLWVNDLRLADAVAACATPLEVVDTTVIERRCTEWMALTRSVAAEIGYAGRLNYLYASKANMAAEVTHAAYRSGWHAETSSTQDLRHLEWLRRHGLLPEGMRVVCNGFKLPPPGAEAAERTTDPAAGAPSAVPPSSGGRLAVPRADRLALGVDGSYAATIVRLRREGWRIEPILDAGELPYFAAAGVPLDVGLRLKFGRVVDRPSLAACVSRFGLSPEQLASAAAAVAAAPNVTLTTLHAMVGAAEEIPLPEMVAAYRVAGAIWSELRAAHPTLIEINLGGGVPPLSENYDHAGLVRGVLTALAEAAAAAGVPSPDVTYELGSLVAEEAGIHVFGVLQTKDNDDRPVDWALIDGGLMAAIPDMLLIDKSFRMLATRGADRPARALRLGDVTCDSDGRYPPKRCGEDAAILLPEGDDVQVAILGVGAYQEILSGVRGAHHCGLLEALELIVERGADGVRQVRLTPRQTWRDAAHVLGYTDETAEALGRTRARPVE